MKKSICCMKFIKFRHILIDESRTLTNFVSTAQSSSTNYIFLKGLKSKNTACAFIPNQACKIMSSFSKNKILCMLKFFLIRNQFCVCNERLYIAYCRMTTSTFIPF
jgi:hypothetical protein